MASPMNYKERWALFHEVLVKFTDENHVARRGSFHQPGGAGFEHHVWPLLNEEVANVEQPNDAGVATVSDEV